MAKKIKFPLVMKEGAETRTLEEFKEHFDIEKAVGYFLDGKLLTWLEARYYDTEADAVRTLDKNDAELRKKLCGIFGTEYDEADSPALDIEAAEERNRKLAKLRQYTSDQAILDKVDFVAFDQEDLADLLDNNVHDIYLCNNSFTIPLRVEDKKYIGIGKAEAVIKSEEWVDFAAKKIVFENVEFDAAYEKNLYGLPASFQCPICKASSDKFAKDEKDDSKWICGICGYVHKYSMANTSKFFCCSDTENQIKWVCDICGYIYESPSDTLPQGFSCPICKAPVNKFSIKQ